MKEVTLTILLFLIICPGIDALGNELSPETFLRTFFIKKVEIDDIFFPAKLVVDDSRIYLVDKKFCRIHIFSKTDGKKLATFGQKGEGPSEFISITDFQCNQDALYFCSPSKMSVFSKEGKLINEVRVYALEKTFIPFQGNYISKRYVYNPKTNQTVLAYVLLDPKLKRIKDIFQTPYKRVAGKDINREELIFFNDCRKGIVSKDRFYVGDTDLGFYIGVFDSNGNKLYDIRKEYEKIHVSDDLKRRIIENIKTVAGESYVRFQAKREVLFPEFIPAFLNFFVENDKIWVFKFPKIGSNGLLELLCLDLRGNNLGQITIPMGSFYKQLENNDYVSFNNGKLYFLDPHQETFWLYELNLDALVKLCTAKKEEKN